MDKSIEHDNVHAWKAVLAAAESFCGFRRSRDSLLA